MHSPEKYFSGEKDFLKKSTLTLYPTRKQVKKSSLTPSPGYFLAPVFLPSGSCLIKRSFFAPQLLHLPGLQRPSSLVPHSAQIQTAILFPSFRCPPDFLDGPAHIGLPENGRSSHQHGGAGLNHGRCRVPVDPAVNL